MRKTIKNLLKALTFLLLGLELYISITAEMSFIIVGITLPVVLFALGILWTLYIVYPSYKFLSNDGKSKSVKKKNKNKVYLLRVLAVISIVAFLYGAYLLTVYCITGGPNKGAYAHTFRHSPYADLQISLSLLTSSIFLAIYIHLSVNKITHKGKRKSLAKYLPDTQISNSKKGRELTPIEEFIYKKKSK